MIKKIDDDLYQILCGWWEKHGWPVLGQDLLGNQGYIYFLDDKPIIAGFLYKAENSSFGMVEWIVSNPESTREQRDLGFKELMEKLLQQAEILGIKYLVTTSIHPSLIERLQGVGFSIDYTGITQLIKEI